MRVAILPKFTDINLDEEPSLTSSYEEREVDARYIKNRIYKYIRKYNHIPKIYITPVILQEVVHSMFYSVEKNTFIGASIIVQRTVNHWSNVILHQ